VVTLQLLHHMRQVFLFTVEHLAHTRAAASICQIHRERAVRKYLPDPPKDALTVAAAVCKEGDRRAMGNLLP
jgi:hypothetical protein